MTAGSSWRTSRGNPSPASDPNTTDTDGDGIADAIDSNPTVASAGFTDGAGTAGTVGANPGALTVGVADAAAPDGVLITVGAGTGQVTLSVCSGFTIRLNPGTVVTLTCGSVRLDVSSGQAQVVLGNGVTVVTVPAGSEAKVSDSGGGSYAVENLGGAVTVSVDGVTASVAPGPATTVATWLRRVLSAGRQQRSSQQGQGRAGVPIKWRLLSSAGTPVTNLASATITVKSLNCSLGTTVDAIEETVAGSSGLQNQGNGYYQLNWKSPTSYANSCKTMQLDLHDGVTHDALFQFTKS